MLLNKQLTSNYQLVEITIPANSPNQKFSFPDQPLLRDKAIEKIECYNFGGVGIVEKDKFNYSNIT